MSDPILVTGGAGFIGSHLVDALLGAGGSVTVLDNFSTGHRRNLSEASADPKLTIVDGTILDAELVDRLVGEHARIYHLAAAVGVSHIVRDPLTSILTNVRGTEHVLSAAHRHGRAILLASTSEVYGRSDAVPFREDSERVLGPTSVHRWSYSTAKALDEHLAFAYADLGLNVTIVRYFNSYGPRLDERGYGSVVARFIKQALGGRSITVHGDGRQTRCFTFVSDTVRGTLLAGNSPEARGRVFNIGSTTEVTIRDLAVMVRELARVDVPIEFVDYASYYGPGFEDTRRRVPDGTAARTLLGFEAPTPLGQGLASTIAWCRQHFAGPLAS